MWRLAVVVLTACLPLAAQQNLLANGDFETDANQDGMPDGWDQERQRDTPGSFARDTTVVATGAASLRIEHHGTGRDWVRSSQQGIPARPRTLYRLDVRAKGTGSYVILLYEFTPDNKEQPYLTHSVGRTDGGHDEWRSYGIAVTTTELARSFKVSLIVDGQGIAWFDDVRLVRVGEIPAGDALAVDVPPTIDGVLDEPCWQRADRLGPFYLLGGTGERPRAATFVAAVWTRSDLYLAFWCDEPEPGRLKADQTEYDSSVYLDDSVEVFLDPSAAGTGYAHLVVNSRGTRYDDRQLQSGYNTTWYATAGGRRVDWDPLWAAAAQVGADRWTVEIRLPFEACGAAPRSGDTWAANFCRERYVEPELSTWSPLPGDTFLQPDKLGRLTFRGPAETPLQVLSREPQHFPATGPLTPQPKQAEYGPALSLDGPLQLRPRSPEAATYLAGCARILSAEVVPADTPDSPRVVDLRVAGPDDQPLPAEGYQLTATERGITVIGADPLGVRNGLMTLAQLLRFDGEHRWLPRASLRDWPDLPVRAWHVASPMATEGDAFRNWVETLAKLKYNTLILEVNDHLQYETHPEIARAGAPTKAQLAEWVSDAKALGFNVIPQVQVYGHFGWVLDKPGWIDLAENPEPDPRWGRWNANIRDPRYYPLVFALFGEVIEVFRPSIFHIGHDEITFRPIGVHAATRDSKPHELLAEEVGRLHQWLTARGLRVMMWGDQLLAEHHGGRPYDTYLATDLLPKDIIIADWHYGPNETYPSVRYFKDHGYEVLCCGWWDPLNMVHFSNTAVDEATLGFSGTSWWGLTNFANSAEHQTAFVLAAENSWSNRAPTIDDLPYEPQQIWRELSGWGGVPAETRYAPLDLGRVANQSLTDTRARGGWLGLGPEHDFRTVPRGLQWWWGVPYRIAEEPPEAILLAKVDDPPQSWPTAVRGIPVGAKARRIWFLHTCEAPARRYTSIYDRAQKYPKNLGAYEIHYADGSREEVPIRYRWSIADWNDGLPPAWGTTVWRGRTLGGAITQLAAYGWLNPHPDKVIESLDIRGAEGELRVAVLAITLGID